MSAPQTHYRMSAKLFSRVKYKEEKAKNYIDKHFEWLRSHDFLQPIIEAYCNEEIDPTSSLHALQEALLYNDNQRKLKEAEASINKCIQKDQEPSISDNYTITIYVRGSNGLEVGTRIVKHKRENPETGVIETFEEQEEMVYSAPMFYDAYRKANRVLVDCHHAVSADIENNYGPKVITNITRTDAFADVYKKKLGPATRSMGKREAPLTSKMKSKNDRARGPWESFR